MNPYSHHELLRWLGDSPAAHGLNTVDKVRLLTTRLAEIAAERHDFREERGSKRKFPQEAQFTAWCALYELVVEALGQDTSLWRMDFSHTVCSEGIQIWNRTRLRDVVDELSGNQGWGCTSEPAKPWQVEGLPYFSSFFRSPELKPRGSVEIKRFMT